MNNDNRLKSFEELLEEQDRLMKNDTELKTFEELLEEQEKLMKDPKYDEFKKKYYCQWITKENTSQFAEQEEPTSKLQSKYDRELLQKQSAYITNDIKEGIGYGGATMIKPYVAQRINANPIDDASNITSLKHMLNKQFGKD